MAKRYDVIVVGAGPAGLMTAKTACESGLKVALLERKTDISKIYRTDGGIIGINHYLFGEVAKFNRKTQTFVFPVNGFSLKYEGQWNHDLYGFQIYSPGGNRFMLGDWKELKNDPEKNSQGIGVSKGKFLRGILDEAGRNGVEYFPNVNVTGVEKIETGAVVTANGEDYQGKFVVAADGVNSRIMRLMGLNKNRRFFGTMRNQTWLVEGGNIPDPEGLKLIVTMYGIFAVSSQYKKGLFHLGTLTYDPNVDLGNLIQRFTKEDAVYSSWFSDVKGMECKEACVVSVWQPIEIPFKDNIIYVGDACWSQEFSIVASLCAGNKLGHALTMAFHDKKFDEEGLALYLDWYSKYCFEPHGRGVLRGSLNISEYLTAEEIDYLAALPERPAPHTLSFYKLFETIKEVYGKLVPQIYEERPEIMDKLIGMREKNEEVMERIIKEGFANR